MRKDKAMEMLATFPPEDELILKQIRRDVAPYLIINNDEAYCNCCGQTMPIDRDTKASISHRNVITCPNCLESVQAIYGYHTFNGNVIQAKGNYVVFYRSDDTDWLYVRCYSALVYFEQYKLKPIINIVETQRYIFDDKHAVRYGRNYNWECHKLLSESYDKGYVTYYTKSLDDAWVMRTKYDEPKFEVKHTYTLLNTEAIADTCMRHCMLEASGATFVLRYLRWYQQHKGAERLIKAGLVDVIKPAYQYYYGSSGAIPEIDWSKTEPHKMLGVPRPVVAAIRDGLIKLDSYKSIYERFPDMSLDKLISYDDIIRSQYNTFDAVENLLGDSESRILKYLRKQERDIGYYDDYLRMCRQLDEDITDRVIRYPKDLDEAHERVRSAIAAIRRERRMLAEAKRNAQLQTSIEERREQRRLLEFEHGDLFVRQPESVVEIKDEGKALHHCVGGYAERHANGALSIMFLRRKSDPDTPYYTIEVGLDYRIVQCRGAHNNQTSLGGTIKPDKIEDFEERYQEYLYSVARKRTKAKDRVSA